MPQIPAVDRVPGFPAARMRLAKPEVARCYRALPGAANLPGSTVARLGPRRVSAGYRSRAARFAGRPPAGWRKIGPEDQRSLIPPGALAGRPRAPGTLVSGSAAAVGRNKFFIRFSTRVRPARRRPVGSLARRGCFWFRAGPGSCATTRVKFEIGGRVCHSGSGALSSLPGRCA